VAYLVLIVREEIMKTAICGIIFLVVFYASAFASANSAEVHAAQLNLKSTNIEVEITYSACRPHQFEMQMKSCTRAKPANCVVELVDMSPADVCRAFITGIVEVPVAQLIENRYVKHLIVVGAEESAVEIDLGQQIF
jgi:hypothetical protein